MQTSEYWEPWQPTLGDRVRVQLNQECEFWAHKPESWDDGGIGIVTRIVPLDRNAGHGYEVTFEKPWPFDPADPDHQVVSSPYAAAELEPIDQ